MPSRAVIFDLFETLVHHVDTELREQALAQLLAAGVSREEWRRGWLASQQVAYRQPISLRRRVLEALRCAEMDPCDEALADRVAGLLQGRFYVELLPDVRPALAELRRRGYRLAIVTNMGTDERPALEVFELPRLVDTTIVSYEVGLAKPDARIYLLAAKRLSVSPAECVFVDDHPGYIAAARAAGLTAAFIQRPECYDDLLQAECDLCIRGLQELLDWLPENAGD